jgi:hypothetical protein
VPRSPRPLFVAIGTALSVFAVAFAAACGGGGSEDVNTVIDKTFSSKQKLDSGKLKLDATARLEGATQLQGPITVKMSGPFEGLETKIAETGEIPTAELDMSAAAGGQTFKAGFTSTGDKVFVNFRGTDYQVPEGQFQRLKRQLARAQAEDAKSKSPDLAALGIQPNDWLKDPTNEGTETVGGTETIHIKGGVDINKMLDDFDRLLKQAGKLNLSREQQSQLPKEIPQSTRDQIEKSIEKAELDLYTGKDDKVLRKFHAKIRFNVPEELRQQASGLKSGEIELSVEIADVNEDQTITAPKSAKPLSELQNQLRSSGFGSLGNSGSGSSGSGSSTTPGGSSPSAAQSRKYLKCVQNANGTAELNKCSELLR